MAIFWKDIGWRCRSGRPVHSADLMSLIHLYQPMIGASAMSLYMTLAYQLPLIRAGVSEIHSHAHLLKLCSLNTEQLLKARYLLEGVGLLNTYEKKDPEQGSYYEYELIPPLSPVKFFQSDILSMTLYHFLGKEGYLAVRDLLIDKEAVAKQPDDGQVKDITKSFQEVFKSLSPAELARSAEQNRDTIWSDMDIDENLLNGKDPQLRDEIDFAMLKMRLSSIVDDDCWTSELMRDLMQIRFLYQLDDWALLKALQNPYVTRHGRIDLDRLRSYVKSEYRLRFGGAPVVSHREAKREAEGTAPAVTPPANTEQLSEEEKHFQQLAQISPLELLAFYQGGARIPDSDVVLVETLVRHYGLPPEVINVLLEYVLLKYDYRLPRNLVEKIAGHWKRLGIKTIQEALEQARKETWEPKKKETPRRSKRSNKKEEKLPQTLKWQLDSSNDKEAAPSVQEELADKQASIQAKLRLMNERLHASKQEKEKLP
ncbi:replication initiation and membrane attachment family protein [Laceyella putida]|uniref:Replication initiation and membrane attachment family protein n=1 Tax=Laceyella putida TaxID=110101 RepID=A0ABW2RPM3_9BACL